MSVCRCALTEGEWKTGTDRERRREQVPVHSCLETSYKPQHRPSPCVSGGQSSLIEQSDASPYTSSVSKRLLYYSHIAKEGYWSHMLRLCADSHLFLTLMSTRSHDRDSYGAVTSLWHNCLAFEAAVQLLRDVQGVYWSIWVMQSLYISLLRWH